MVAAIKSPVERIPQSRFVLPHLRRADKNRVPEQFQQDYVKKILRMAREYLKRDRPVNLTYEEATSLERIPNLNLKWRSEEAGTITLRGKAHPFVIRDEELRNEELKEGIKPPLVRINVSKPQGAVNPTLNQITNASKLAAKLFANTLKASELSDARAAVLKFNIQPPLI